MYDLSKEMATEKEPIKTEKSTTEGDKEEGFSLRKTIYLRSRSIKKQLQTIVEEEMVTKKDSEPIASEPDAPA